MLAVIYYNQFIMHIKKNASQFVSKRSSSEDIRIPVNIFIYIIQILSVCVSVCQV